MSTVDPPAEPNGQPQLSKEQLRRQRILAKRGARMALVTGDQTLAAADPVAPSMRDAPPPAATAAESSDTDASAPQVTAARADPPSRAADEPSSDAVEPSIPIMPQLSGMRAVGGDAPSRKVALTPVPAAVRTLLMAGGGVALPYLRARTWERLSALQLFLALEGVMLAPEVATWVDGGALGALVGVARQLSAVWKDLALFMLALFVSLHMGA